MNLIYYKQIKQNEVNETLQRNVPVNVEMTEDIPVQPPTTISWQMR